MAFRTPCTHALVADESIAGKNLELLLIGDGPAAETALAALVEKVNREHVLLTEVDPACVTDTKEDAH